MQTTERQHLIETMSQPPMRPLAAVLKCVACLAFLFLLVIIGNSRDDAALGERARPAAARVSPSGQASDAEAHRKELFDTRRARFTGHPPEGDVADSTKVTPAAAAEP